MNDTNKRKDELIRMRMLVAQEDTRKNAKYGKFIIQANQIQYLIICVIALRAYMPSKKLLAQLEELTLGALFENFRLCVKSKLELSLVQSLNLHKGSRNALAHRMFTAKELIEKECELAIELGEELETYLEKVKEEEIKEWRATIENYRNKK